ncbi:hypothetical protein G5C01_08435 [Moraxella bovoculi]|uniref:hypothetical protein n=1 Tax=Moraxella bovoculi TaxID=386891 RepID=UPI00156E97A4|nr:hypothetical protein [Moraxella bovoculi]NSM11372.1 hypothetical protein [Moraxella bovoculi]
MKKYLILALAVATASVAHANTPKNLSVFADYSAYDAKSDAGDSKLTGFGIGLSSSPHNHGFYGGFDYLKNDGIKLYHMDFGYQHNLYNQNGLYALGKIGAGFASADVDALSNKNNFLTLPIGAEIGYTFTPNISAYAGVGYQWSFDLTSETTCKDGTQSDSAGRGTCSWHGGVAYYNDKIGTVNGLSYNAGLRYNF